MFLQAKGIDNDNGFVGILIQVRRLSDNDGGVGRGRLIDDASKVLETTTEAARIRGR